MTKEDAKQLLPIIQAWTKGKAIQFYTGSAWTDIENYSKLDFSAPAVHYRIKPEPREWWINLYDCAGAAHVTKELAEKASSKSRIECVHVREVID